MSHEIVGMHIRWVSKGRCLITWPGPEQFETPFMLYRKTVMGHHADTMLAMLYCPGTPRVIPVIPCHTIVEPRYPMSYHAIPWVHRPHWYHVIQRYSYGNDLNTSTLCLTCIRPNSDMWADFSCYANGLHMSCTWCGHGLPMVGHVPCIRFGHVFGHVVDMFSTCPGTMPWTCFGHVPEYV